MRAANARKTHDNDKTTKIAERDFFFYLSIKMSHTVSLFNWFIWIQQPAGCASAHGCNDCRPANGGANGVDACDDCDVAAGPKPLLNASACNESIKRFAACRSASRSSAVWRLQKKLERRREREKERERGENQTKIRELG